LSLFSNGVSSSGIAIDCESRFFISAGFSEDLLVSGGDGCMPPAIPAPRSLIARL
jgi:hypothetical protein